MEEKRRKQYQAIPFRSANAALVDNSIAKSAEVEVALSVGLQVRPMQEKFTPELKCIFVISKIIIRRTT